MYGFLRLPDSAGSEERHRYRKYMCALCGTLHKIYGIKARLLVNYDCTTLALLMGSLDKSFDEMVLSTTAKKVVSCISKSKKMHHYLRFISAVSVVLAYTKFLDRAIDSGKKIPKWIIQMSTIAFDELSPYGLTRSFLKHSLERQHKLERSGCCDIEDLSAVSCEVISRICVGVADLTNKSEVLGFLKALGKEVGKIIYVLDGLSDYHKDAKKGYFNCIMACYSEKKQDSSELNGFLDGIRTNIASVINEMQMDDADLLKTILLECSAVRLEVKRCGNKALIQQGVYSLLGSVWIAQPKGDDLSCIECCKIQAVSCAAGGTYCICCVIPPLMCLGAIMGLSLLCGGSGEKGG